MLDVRLSNIHAEQIKERDIDSQFALTQSPVIPNDIWVKCAGCRGTALLAHTR